MKQDSFKPKLFSVLADGYSSKSLKNDLKAGLTVAIVALPLSMAFAIASGSTPDKGLITAIIGGFLISALGGSRFQIAGPTGAFVVLIADIIQKHGYQGLAIASILAGIILIALGLAKLGTIIEYIPFPVITGSTAGLGFLLFFSQIKDFLGLQTPTPSGEFIHKFSSIIQNLHAFHTPTLIVALSSLATVILIKRFKPSWPSSLIGLAIGTLVSIYFNLPVETIQSRFGNFSATIPAPSLPSFSWSNLTSLIPPAFTIAFLGAIESLITAVIADTLTGTKHRSNCELLAQGIGNIAVSFFGGIPVTGAPARTTANIKSGAETPLAGIFHCLFLASFMFFLAKYISLIPLASLAAILIVVAWNMSEIEHFRYLLKAPKGDKLVLILTFLLTVFLDISTAIELGLILALLLFTKQMINFSQLRFHKNSSSTKESYVKLPPHTELIHINGPFFFGIASLLSEAMEKLRPTPKHLIISMENVPFIDATGAQLLKNLLANASKSHSKVILTNLSPSIESTLQQMLLLSPSTNLLKASSINDAIITCLSSSPPKHPSAS